MAHQTNTEKIGQSITPQGAQVDVWDHVPDPDEKIIYPPTDENVLSGSQLPLEQKTPRHRKTDEEIVEAQFVSAALTRSRPPQHRK